MITFVVLIYLILCFVGIVNTIFWETDGLDGVIKKVLFLPVFVVLFIMGVIAMMKLYNIHLTIGN